MAGFAIMGLVAFGLGSTAQAATYNVSSVTDIWLAGQPDGTIATGYFGSDTAPANSPVLVSVTAGNTLTFSASGSTSVDTSCFAGPDGGCYADESGFGVGPANGIGTYQGPSNALLGVFLDNTTPSGTGGPASLDYTQAENISQLFNTPGLNQIFFIGDGLTGTGSGSVQEFMAPDGATRLFLAVADSYGSSFGNLGELTVEVAAVPLPGAALLLGSGLLGLLGLGSRRRGY